MTFYETLDCFMNTYFYAICLSFLLSHITNLSLHSSCMFLTGRKAGKCFIYQGRNPKVPLGWRDSLVPSEQCRKPAVAHIMPEQGELSQFRELQQPMDANVVAQVSQPALTKFGWHGCLMSVEDGRREREWDRGEGSFMGELAWVGGWVWSMDLELRPDPNPHSLPFGPDAGCPDLCLQFR